MRIFKIIIGFSVWLMVAPMCALVAMSIWIATIGIKTDIHEKSCFVIMIESIRFMWDQLVISE